MNRVKSTFFYLMLTGLVYNCFSQTVADTTEILHMNEIAADLWFTNPDSCNLIANEALIKSRKIAFPLGESESLLNIGAIYYFKSSLDSAEKYWYQSYDVAKSNHLDDQVAKCLSYLAIIEQDNKEYLQAIKFIEESLEIITKRELTRDDSINMGRSYNNIGDILLELENYDRATEYFNKSLNIYNACEYDYSLGIIYANIGMAQMHSNQIKKGKELIEKAVILSEKGSKRVHALAISSLAQINFIEKKYEEAYVLYDSVRKIKAIYSTPTLISETVKMMEISLIQQQYSNVISLAQEIDINRDQTNPEDKSAYYKLLAQAYRNKNHITKSNRAWEKHVLAEDSLKKSNYKLELQREEVELFYRFKETEAIEEAEKREDELLQDMKYRQNLTIRLVAFSFVLIILFTLIIKSHHILRLRNKNLEHQKLTIQTLLEDQKILLNKKSLELVSSRKLLNRFAFLSTEELRAPIAKLLTLFNVADKNKMQQKNFVDQINECVVEIDQIVRKIAEELRNKAT